MLGAGGSAQVNLAGQGPVVRKQVQFRALTISVLLCLLVAPGSASAPSKTTGTSVQYRYHARIPLGSENFSVQLWQSGLTVLASAENPEFEGWGVNVKGENRRVVDAFGQPVRFYPDEVTFRVTIGTRTRLSDTQPFPLRVSLAANDYLLNVRFRVKIFHGLHPTMVEPSAVELIGVPADIAYDERIYRVSFHLDDISITDRVVLEVLAPSGERLCKFHLDL